MSNFVWHFFASVEIVWFFALHSVNMVYHIYWFSWAYFFSVYIEGYPALKTHLILKKIYICQTTHLKVAYSLSMQIKVPPLNTECFLYVTNSFYVLVFQEHSDWTEDQSQDLLTAFPFWLCWFVTISLEISFHIRHQKSVSPFLLNNINVASEGLFSYSSAWDTQTSFSSL